MYMIKTQGSEDHNLNDTFISIIKQYYTIYLIHCVILKKKFSNYTNEP